MKPESINIQQFQTIFESACVGVVIADREGVIRAVNKYVLSEFGYDRDELTGKVVEVLIPGDLRERHQEKRTKLATHPHSVAVPAYKNLKALRKNGTEFIIELSLGYYIENKETLYVIFLNELSRKQEAQDTIKRLIAELSQRVRESTRSLNSTVDQLSSQIKENERKDGELKKALEKEKELNELKSRFVSVASHEFRTPLSGILASTYLLSKYTREEEQAQRDKHIKRIISSVNLLNEVLGDFLSVDKMEQESFKPNLTKFQIHDVISNIIQGVNHLLKKGQKLEYIHKGDNNIAHIDQSMFQHILTNLLSNAIKYSPEDSPIRLTVIQKDHLLTIKVKDEGIGIPRAEQKNLFKRFFRSSNVTGIEGTGLGLNIVKKYVDVLDGRIRFKSEEDKGTEFTITFNNQTEQYENHSGS